MQVQYYDDQDAVDKELMTKKLIIVGNNYSRARDRARELGLKPSEWRHAEVPRDLWGLHDFPYLALWEARANEELHRRRDRQELAELLQAQRAYSVTAERVMLKLHGNRLKEDPKMDPLNYRLMRKLETADPREIGAAGAARLSQLHGEWHEHLEDLFRGVWQGLERHQQWSTPPVAYIDPKLDLSGSIPALSTSSVTMFDRARLSDIASGELSRALVARAVHAHAVEEMEMEIMRWR